MMGLMRRGLVALLIVVLGTVAGGAESVAKQDLKVELFYSGVWNDHSTDVYTRDPVSIAHAAGNEQTGLVPSEASLTFQGRDGRMNPANRAGPLHGLIGRNTPIRISAGTDVRFSGQVVSWKPRRAIKGDAWVHIVAGGHLRQLGQGEPPVESALKRWIRLNNPYVWWPLDGGQLSTVAQPEVGDADPFQPLGDPGAFGGAVLAPWLESGVTISTGNVVMRSMVRGMDTNPTSLTVDHVRRGDGGGAATSFLDIFGNRAAGGTLFGISTDPAFQEIAISAIEDDGAGGQETFGPIVYPALFTDGLHHMRFSAVQAGADITVRLEIDGLPVILDTFNSAALSGVGRVQLSYAPGSTPAPLAFGHLALWQNHIFDIADGPDAAFGYPGEKAGDRFLRLCGEENITATVVGTASDTQAMGPQYPDTVLKLFGEIARTDNARIFDTRSQFGLTMRTGRSLYNQ